MAKKRKVRADFRKNRGARRRERGLTRQFEEHGFEEAAPETTERVSGKGELTRRRTIIGDLTEDDTGTHLQLEVDSECRPGRVLSVHGLASQVRAENGDLYRCATRRLLKTLATDQRHVVVAGDHVLFRPAEGFEGIIERVEPRRGVLARTSKGRQHLLVANVDQLLIVTSAAEPGIKPNLIDRFLAAAEKGGLRPVICINKIDLVDPAELQPLAGVFGQLGYPVLFLSAERGWGVERLRRYVKGRSSVVAGQSGVGKSSLLNALQPELALRVNEVSAENQKGKHTTTSAKLIPLEMGGYVVDTPGIRQFQLWDVVPEEVAGFYRELRPYVDRCRFPDCSHTHEEACAVKDAVADGRIDLRRYDSYCHMLAGEIE